MPDDSQTLSIIVKLKDEASAQLEAMSGKMAAVGESMMAVGQKMTAVGTQMTIGLTLPIVAVGKAVVDASLKFESSMTLIRTQAGATQAEVDAMTKSVLALAKSGETGQGPEKLAEGLYHLESLGLRGAQAMDALKTSAKAADMGMADMEGVTNALGAAIVTGIKGTESFDGAMGLLNATIGQGNMRMNDLVSALGTGILPVAKNFGLSLQDIGAALATLTDNGMGADESATRLRMTLSLMAAPSKKAEGALASIGLASDELAKTMRSNGLVAAVDMLKEHLISSGQTATEQAATLAHAFGGGRTSAAIMTLVEQSDRLKNKFDMIGESAGKFNKELEATHATNQFKLNAALAQMQATLIDLGATVMPILMAALQKFTKLMENLVAWWDKLSPSTQKWMVIATMIVAILGPVLVIIGTLITAIGAIMTALAGLSTFLFGTATAAGALEIALGIIMGPIGLVILGIAALGFAAYELWKHWDAVSGFLVAMWTNIKNVAKVAIDFLIGLVILYLNTTLPGWQEGLKAIAEVWKAAWSGIRDFFTTIATAIASAVGGVLDSINSKIAAVVSSWNSMVSIVSKPIQSAIGAVGGVASGIGNALGNAIGNFASKTVNLGASVTHFEAGGFVNAPRGSEVPVILHGGEEIIPAEQTGGRRGGNVTIVIQNPVVRKNSDLEDMRKMVEQVLRPVLLNAKVIHI